jgi:DNA-binding winged helix-turn-helix (wHTH) protein
MASRFRIGGVTVFDSGTGEVTRADATVRLEPQPSALLTMLASRPGDLITHEELRKGIWGDATHVSFRQSLHYCVRQIRRALDDTVRTAPMVETIPRRGYRMRAQVDLVPPPARAPQPLRSRTGRWPAWLAGAAISLSLVAFLERRPNNHHRIAVEVIRAVHDLVY